MIVLHHLNNSRSQRILWLLEEMNLPYEIQFYQRDPKTMLAPSELTAVHPLGKSPVITDGSEVIAESANIIEYILDKYGPSPLRPVPGAPEYFRFRYWLHYAEGSAMPPLLLKLVFSVISKAKVPFLVKPIVKGIAAQANKSFIDPQLKLHFDYIERELAKFAWFAGNEFSAADIQMSFPVEAALSRHVINKNHPNILSYLERIHQRPAYQRALQKGGPFELAD